MPSTRTKATSIPTDVKKKVHERDNGQCLVCGRPVPWNMSCAHIIPRTKGGLGIEENIVTLCQDDHYAYDYTNVRSMLYDYFVEYQKKNYPDWDKGKMIFKKGQNNV